MSKRLICLLFAALPGLWSLAQKPATTIPSFIFVKEDQSGFTKDNLPKGRSIFFIFFDPGCDHCQRTVAQLDKQYSKLLKPAIYFVTLDKPAGARSFMQRYAKNLSQQKNVMVLYDVRYQFIPKFKPVKYPSMFLYDKQGKLVKYSDEEKETGKMVALVAGVDK